MVRQDAIRSSIANATSGIITLTTDFGASDTFVAQMKGVILSINIEAKIVDITHEIKPFSIISASQAIKSAYSYFPEGSIHIVVTDPGVGSERRGLLLYTGCHYFIGPDNGIFTPVIRANKDYEAVSIRHERLLSSPPSNTFHGRDIFAPVAAYLSMGRDMHSFGERVEDLVILEDSLPLLGERLIKGAVTHIDNFGNAMTNIPFSAVKGRPFKSLFRDREAGYCEFYQQAEGKALSCIINSQGFIELFVFKEKAAEIYNIKVGDEVIILLT